MDASQLQINDYVRLHNQSMRVLAISAPEGGRRYLELQDGEGNLWHEVSEDDLRQIDLTDTLRKSLNIPDRRFLALHEWQQWQRLLRNFDQLEAETYDEAAQDEERNIMYTIDKSFYAGTILTVND